MNSRKTNKNKGFTLIEILVVIGIIAILAAVVIIAINPARQFAQARNTQRTANVNAILNAIGQNMADNKGIFTCENDTDSSNDPLPGTTESMEKGTGAGIYDIRPCIVPTYITEVPVDPSTGVNDCNSTCSGTTTYNTEYTVDTDANGRVEVCAPGGVESAISGSTPICVTR